MCRKPRSRPAGLHSDARLKARDAGRLLCCATFPGYPPARRKVAVGAKSDPLLPPAEVVMVRRMSHTKPLKGPANVADAQPTAMTRRALSESCVRVRPSGSDDPPRPRPSSAGRPQPQPTGPRTYPTIMKAASGHLYGRHPENGPRPTTPKDETDSDRIVSQSHRRAVRGRGGHSVPSAPDGRGRCRPPCRPPPQSKRRAR
jgi:hypothetical protein